MKSLNNITDDSVWWNKSETGGEEDGTRREYKGITTVISDPALYCKIFAFFLLKGDSWEKEEGTPFLPIFHSASLIPQQNVSI